MVGYSKNKKKNLIEIDVGDDRSKVDEEDSVKRLYTPDNPYNMGEVNNIQKGPIKSSVASQSSITAPIFSNGLGTSNELSSQLFTSQSRTEDDPSHSFDNQQKKEPGPSKVISKMEDKFNKMDTLK